MAKELKPRNVYNLIWTQCVDTRSDLNWTESIKHLLDSAFQLILNCLPQPHTLLLPIRTKWGLVLVSKKKIEWKTSASLCLCVWKTIGKLTSESTHEIMSRSKFVFQCYVTLFGSMMRKDLLGTQPTERRRVRDTSNSCEKCHFSGFLLLRALCWLLLQFFSFRLVEF